jgi:hypothetical protein
MVAVATSFTCTIAGCCPVRIANSAAVIVSV